MDQERRSQRSDARQQTRVRPSVTMVDQRKENYHYEEALKTLRTNIQFAGAEITSILVTSCYPNEGKSDIVSQLAKEMGKAGKKVLLLDADIRKSTFIQRFQIEGEIKGLSQYLSGQVAVRDILYTTNYENVDMIFAGPVAPNPSELLEGKLFAHLVERLSQRYDYILIDAPPTLGGWVMNILCASDKVIIPVEASPWGMFGLANMFEFLNEVKQISPDLEVAGIAVTKVDTRKNYFKQTMETLHQLESIYVFEHVIRVDSSVEWSQDNSVPVVEYKKSSRSAKEYTELAEEVMNRVSR